MKYLISQGNAAVLIRWKHHAIIRGLLPGSSEVAATIQFSVAQRAAMDRLLASETFLHAPRVQAVLRFLLESLQNGEIHRINEQAIGQDVFGRPTGYNAAEDNIVRVTVRHLRARLDRFYKTEGRDEEWVVQIPIGNYIPVIRARETRARETETDPAVELPKLLGLGSAATSQSYARWVWAFLALLLASNLLTYYFVSRAAVHPIERLCSFRSRPGALLRSQPSSVGRAH